MRDVAVQTAKSAGGQRLHVLREYVQNEILALIQKSGANLKLYFVGGTALRFLYRIPRYSEDLDFSAGPNWNPEEFRDEMEEIRTGLALGGYHLSTTVKEDRIVQKASFRFSQLLHDVGLSPHRNQNLFISFEVDIRPPEGWSGERTIVNIVRPILIQHYDLRSLFTSKIAAIMTRPYPKGRDYYDLFWYISRWKNLSPLPEMLTAAIVQKGKERIEKDLSEWKSALRRIISGADWKTLARDVEPFLERADDVRVFTKDNLLGLLSG